MWIDGSARPRKSSVGLTALWGLVLIPLLAVIVCLVMRKKNDDGSGNKKADRSLEVHDISEAPPTPSTRVSASQRHEEHSSVTESSDTDDYLYGHRRGGAAASHNSRREPAADSMQSRGGSGRRDPSGSPGRNHPSPLMPPPGPRPRSSDGKRMLENKDQCRSTAGEQEVPFAIIVDQRALGRSRRVDENIPAELY